MRKLCIVMGTLALAAVLVTTSAANRGVDFIPIGIPDGASGFFGTTMTYDGTRVGGSAGGFGNAGGCLDWTEDDGFNTFAFFSGVCYMSKDGSGIMTDQLGDDGYIHAATWNGSEFVIIPDGPGAANCDSTVNTGYFMSGDASTVVGLAYEGGCGQSQAHAFASFGGSTSYLDQINTERPARANVVNHDGSVIGGWNDDAGRQGVIWTNGVPAKVSDTGYVGEVYALNSTGTVAGGGVYAPNGPREGWIYKDGTLTATGAFPGAFFLDLGWNFAVNEEGTLAGGRFGFGPFSQATLWSPTTGQINLNQFLIDQGRTEPFDGWQLVQVNAMSADGLRMVVFGQGPDAGSQSAILDITKVSVCHQNPGHTKTLNVSWDGAMDHVGHGDFLGTCEAAGIGTRAADTYEFHGVDPMNPAFQKAVQSYIETHDPREPVSPKAMRYMIEASQHLQEDVGDHQRVRTPVRSARPSRQQR